MIFSKHGSTAIHRFGAVVVTLFSVWSCASSERVEAPETGALGRHVDPPALPGALAPDLALVGGSVAATWLEPIEVEDGKAHRLRFSRFVEGVWSEPVTIVEGADFFANWADIPAVVETGDGDLLAHWLAKTAEETYAYSVFLARSRDGGVTWETFGRLNADVTDTEHGFVSWIREGDGARAVWLDGRAMTEGGAMSLRTALVTDTVGDERVLDERTCECCSTDIAMTGNGPVVVYRDRSAEEIRDVAVVRRANGMWSDPEQLYDDGWKIDGCPVNGPAITAAGSRTAIGWFSAAGGSPKVQLALSAGAAEAADRVVLIDDDSPMGRVDVVLDARGDAWIVWLASRGEVADVRLRRVDFDGGADQVLTVAETAASRASGFPRLLASGDALYVLWVEVLTTGSQRLRFLELSPAPPRA